MRWSVAIACLVVVAFAFCALSGAALAARDSTRVTKYREADLVSDIPRAAQWTDPLLVNPWGLAFGPTGILWVNDNGTGVSTLYRANGRPFPLVVTVPPPLGQAGPSTPTGIAFNGTSDFVVTQDSMSGPSRFIFATEDGTISGWNPAVDLTNAILAVDNSGAEAVYKGVAIAKTQQGENRLYVTNFRDGVVEAYAADWTFLGTFTDGSLPDDYAPFGISNINGLLWVTFAKQKPPDNKDDLPGPGNGFVDVFDANGDLVWQFASMGALNAPWGLALAPGGFGTFSNALLVGNFGDGRINAYDIETAEFLGQLTDRRGKAIEIEGLWGLIFAPNKFIDVPGRPALPAGLWFAAGINDEADGLLGTLHSVPPHPRGVFSSSRVHVTRRR